MSTMVMGEIPAHSTYPVQVTIPRATTDRNRLTTAFRLILGLPHVLLVGGPIAAALSWSWSSERGFAYDWGTGGGVLGAVAVVTAIIAWFAIVFTGKHPDGLWKLAAFYLRWRVRSVAYIAMLRDEYPPFGDAAYPASLELSPAPLRRDRVSVGFRIILALPHIFAVWALGIAWAFTSIFAWFAILFTGRYPASLYDFAVGVLRWNIRLEAYLLLLRDEYPPFSLQ